MSLTEREGDVLYMERVIERGERLSDIGWHHARIGWRRLHRSLADAEKRIAELEAERDAARAVLAHVASIAHQGGLAGYDYHEALADIRALTIKNWNSTGARADALERLNAAIDAARGRG